MIHRNRGWLVPAALVLTVSAGIGMAAAQPASVQGVWRNADTTIRIAVERNQARALFVEVGPGARALGFKPGEASFVAILNANYLNGEQTIRYGGNCHPAGRKVPMMGRVTPEGRMLAIHFYNIVVDRNCRDTDEYTVTETLWERIPGR